MIPVLSKPFKKIKTTFWLSFFVMLLCVSTYVYFFCFVAQTRQSVVDLTRETTLLEKEELDATSLKKDLASSVANRQAITSYFVEASNPVPFETTLEGYGKIVGVKVNFQGLEVKKDPSRLDVSFTIDGSFQNMYRFLAMLESAPYEISITNLNMQISNPVGLVSDGKASSLASDWHAGVSLSVYSISGVI